MFRDTTKIEEKSARPIITEKYKGPVVPAKHQLKFTKEKPVDNDFESMIVNKEPAQVPKESTPKDEKADDFFQSKHDLGFNSPYGQYGAAAYPPHGNKKQHHQNRPSQQQGYSGRSTFHRGYKPGRVHTPQHGRRGGGGGGYRNPRPQGYRPPNKGYGNNIQEKRHQNQNSN